jgi:hypothetical protein
VPTLTPTSTEPPEPTNIPTPTKEPTPKPKPTNTPTPEAPKELKLNDGDGSGPYTGIIARGTPDENHISVIKILGHSIGMPEEDFLGEMFLL